MGGGLGELAGVGVLHPAGMAGKLHHRHLHPQTDTEEGDSLLPGVPDGGYLTLNSPVTEAAGDQDTVRTGQKVGGVFISDRLTVHPADIHLHLVLDPPVGEGLGHGKVGVVEGDIFSHQSDLHLSSWIFGPVYHVGPLGEVGGVADQPQPPDHHVSQPLPLQHQGHLVEQAGRQIGDGVLPGDAAEQGDLVQNVPGHGGVAAADDHVGLDAQREQLLSRVLGGLGLQLSGAGDGDDEGDVKEHHIVPPSLRGHLTDGLQEGLGLDVAHCAADLHDGRVGVGGVQCVDAALDLVGDVGDYLDGAPQVIPPPLSVQDVPIHLPRRDRGVYGKILVNEPLVVAQV